MSNMHSLSTNFIHNLCINLWKKVSLQRTTLSLFLNPVLYVLQKTPQFEVARQVRRNLINGVHDRGVVSSAECFADLGQRAVSEFSGQIHGDLPGIGHLPAAPF